MWRTHKNVRNLGSVGSSGENLHDGLHTNDDGEWSSSLAKGSASTTSVTLGRRRRRSSKHSSTFASRRKTAVTLASSMLSSSSRRPRTKCTSISLSASMRYRESSRIAPKRAQSDWNLVAQEIETVFFGEINEEERENEGVSREARRNALTSSTDGRNRRGKFGIRFGKWRQKSPTTSTNVNSQTVEVNRLPYNLFDDQQITRPNTISSSRRAQPSPFVIYRQKYQKSPESLFRPISIVLFIIFVTLLAIRIATNLLMSGAGIVVVILLVGRFVREVVIKPIRLLRVLHTSPVLFWACFGAVFCSFDALWRHRSYHFLPLLSGVANASMSTLVSFELMRIRNITSVLVGNDNSDDDDSNYYDLVMLWGLLRGLFYGAEVGSLWLVIFGDSSNPSLLTQRFHRRIWGPVRRYFERAMMRSQDRRRFSLLASKPFGSTADSDLLVSKQENKNDALCHCAICLDCFDSVKEDEQIIGDTKDSQIEEADGKVFVQCQLLPCLHCFHRDCVHHWLTVRHTCPICRVPVHGIQSYD